MVRKYQDMPVQTREHMRDGDGAVKLTEILTQKELMGQGRLFSQITLEPGCSIGTHEHKDEAEIFFLLQGEAQADDNGTPVTLCPGDMLYTGPGCYHSIANRSSEPVRLVALILFDEAH